MKTPVQDLLQILLDKDVRPALSDDQARTIFEAARIIAHQDQKYIAVGKADGGLPPVAP